MRIRTLLVAGTAVVAGTTGGVAWAGTTNEPEPEPSVRIVQHEDCPLNSGQENL